MSNSNLKYLKIFPLTAGLILLLALANYMSLATARSTLRAKEVGVRKVSGASRASLIWQFYTESAVFGVIAFVLAYMLCYLITPWFLNRLQLNIDTAFFHSPVIICSLAALLLFTIVMAGTYPSIVLSAFKPVTTLKGKGDRRSAGYLVRKFFTTTQFIITIALLICGVVIDRQLYFFRNTDTGVNRENVVSIPLEPSFKYNYHSFKNDLQSLAGISQISTAMHPLYNKYYDISTVKGRDADEKITFNSMQVDENFISTLGIQWQYKPASLKNVLMARQVIINEAAAQALHISDNPVGASIVEAHDTLHVAGVVKNFAYASMEKTISPMYFFLIPESITGWGGVAGCVYIKIKPKTNIPQLLGAIQKYYKRYDTETPFSYQFMDDAFNKQYQAEDRLATIFSFFTAITIVLAALGLFGLAAFTIEQRRKEIGIRKILGANLLGITSLLSTEFLKLVVLAVVIASPIAWWAMQNWLQGFAYRIHLQFWMFAAAGVLAIVVAVITVGYHALKAAVANPVDSLRSE